MGDASEGTGGKIPLWVKLLFTLFIVLRAPYWVTDGPITILWFCHVALLLTLVALWLENSLLASMQAVAVVGPQLAWILDFVVQLVTGYRTFGFSDYVFDAKTSLLFRGLSLFHVWMPFFLVWLLWRLGYDRRALVAQTVLAWVVLLLSFSLAKDIHGPAGNVNNVFGLSATQPQTWMPPWMWLAVVMVCCPVCNCLPWHLVFRHVFDPPQPGKPTQTPVII